MSHKDKGSLNWRVYTREETHMEAEKGPFKDYFLNTKPVVFGFHVNLRGRKSVYLLYVLPTTCTKISEHDCYRLHMTRAVQIDSI